MFILLFFYVFVSCETLFYVVFHMKQTHKTFCCCCVCFYLTATPSPRISPRFALVSSYAETFRRRSPLRCGNSRLRYSVIKVPAWLQSRAARLASIRLVLAILCSIGNGVLACYPTHPETVPRFPVGWCHDTWKTLKCTDFFFWACQNRNPLRRNALRVFAAWDLPKTLFCCKIFVKVAQNTRGSVCRGRTPVRLSWMPPCRYTR